jgi:hypothetical protein
MSILTPANNTSRRERIVKLWPYFLIAIAIAGLIFKLIRGSF